LGRNQNLSKHGSLAEIREQEGKYSEQTYTQNRRTGLIQHKDTKKSLGQGANPSSQGRAGAETTRRVVRFVPPAGKGSKKAP